MLVFVWGFWGDFGVVWVGRLGCFGVCGGLFFVCFCFPVQDKELCELPEHGPVS